MTATNATLGKGVVVSHEVTTGTTNSYTALAQLEDVTPVELSNDSVEVSNHDSPDMKVEKIAGWQSLGDSPLTFVHTKTQYDTLLTLAEARTIKNFKFVYPDTSEQIVKGFISKLQIMSPLKDKMVTRVTITSTDSNLSSAGIG